MQIAPDELVSQTLQADPDGVFESVNALTRLLVGEATPDVLAAGWNLFWALAVILTVYTGLRQAFAGEWDVWAVIRLAFALAFPFAMLSAYDTPLRLTAAIPITLPGSADPLTFPELVVAQGGWLAQTVNEDGFEAFWTFVRSLSGKLWEMLASGGAGNLWSPLTWVASFGAATVSLLTLALTLGAFLVALAAAIVGYVQVIVAHVAIGVLVVFGPILIPWILLDKMAFLFWGWLRSMIIYSFYGAVAAALLRIMVALIAGTTSRVLEEVNVGQLLSGSAADAAQQAGDALFWMVTLVVSSLAALVAFFQIPQIAAGMVSGAAGGGGLLEGIATLSGIGRATARVVGKVARARGGGGGAS